MFNCVDGHLTNNPFLCGGKGGGGGQLINDRGCLSHYFLYLIRHLIRSNLDKTIQAHSSVQALRGQHSSGKGGFVVPSVRHSGANPVLGKEDSLFLLSETQGPTQFWERRIRRSLCQKLRGKPSSEKGGFVVPSVRNSGARTILGKRDSLFFLLETQGPNQFGERRIRCSFCQKLRGQPSSGKEGGFVVPSVRNSGANPVLGKKEDSLFLLLETQGPTQFWERRIRCSFCQKLRGQPNSGKGGFVVHSVRNSGANTVLGKEDSLYLLSETQGPTQFWERRVRRSFCQKLRGQHSSGKGGFVVPSVRNSGTNLVEGRGFSLFPPS